MTGGRGATTGSRSGGVRGVRRLGAKGVHVSECVEGRQRLVSLKPRVLAIRVRGGLGSKLEP